MHHRILMFGSLALVFGVLLSRTVADPSGTRYTVTDLGTLPGGDESEAAAINNKGQVVGWADTGATKGVLTAHAFLWQDGKMTDIDVLPDLQKAPGTIARAINDHGEVVGGVQPILPHSTDGHVSQGLGYIYGPRGWLWKNGKLQVIGSDALAIRNDGCVLIKQDQQSLIWRNGKTEAVPSTAGFESTATTAQNNRGGIAGYVSDGAGNSKAFVRLRGKTFLLGTLPGQDTSQAIAVNDNGQVIGRTSGTRSSSAFFWQHGVLTDLGDRRVLGLGDQGQVVGSYSYWPRGGRWTTVAFVWQMGTFKDLNTMIGQNSGWNLETANAINLRGQIVGSGEHNGQEHAFLLTPVRKNDEKECDERIFIHLPEVKPSRAATTYYRFAPTTYQRATEGTLWLIALYFSLF